MTPGVLAHDGSLHRDHQEPGTSENLKNNFNTAGTKQQSPSVDVVPAEAYHDSSNNLLISSPYLTLSHALDLRTLDPQCQLFARALALMTAVRSDYATAEYTASFNWAPIMAHLRVLAQREGVQWEQQRFYTVIFRSKLNENIDRDLLRKLDEESHREAAESGGLLKYWFGIPNDERRNLATCLWRNREDARKGGLGPWHKKARSAARELYERIDFTTWELIIEDDVKGWTLKET